MAGMLALLTASEMALARPSSPPAPTLEPQTDNPTPGADCRETGDLEMVALEGMALLSQMAQREMEQICQERGEERERDDRVGGKGMRRWGASEPSPSVSLQHRFIICLFALCKSAP